MPAIVWPLLLLAGLLLFNLIFTPGFFRVEVRDGHLYGSLLDILDRAAPIAITALGMTLVIATRGVDLSVGAVVAIAGSAAALLIQRAQLPLVGIIAIPLALALVCGMWNGVLVALFRIQPIVATLLLMVAGRGIAKLMTDAQIITFQHAGFSFLGNGHLLGLPFGIWLVAMATAVTALLVRKTALGLFVESIGDNETASFYAGVNARLVKFCCYAFSGFCAGVAGLIYAADIQAADANNAGMYLELDAILAAVIGGTSLNGGRFQLVGAVIGALVIQTLTTTIYVLNMGVEWNLVVKAIVVLAVCLLQSERVRSALRRRRRAVA